MKNNPTGQALEGIARRAVSDHTDLWPRISARLTERKSLMQTLKARPLFVLLIVVLILLLLSGAAYAVGNMLGYIPGIGIIDRSAPLRVLAEPVSLTREGITLTVTEAVLSSDQTVIKLTVQGVPPDAYPKSEADAGCMGAVNLLLPDGALLKGGFISGGNWGSFESRLQYGPVPAGVEQAVLTVDCIGGTIPGRLPADWKIPVRFIPAPPDLTVMPVIDIPPSARPGNTPGSSAPSPSPLTLDKAVELADGYILIGATHTMVLPDGLVAQAFEQSPFLKITDANGQEVYAEPASDVSFPVSTSDDSPWAYKIKGKSFAWPLSISLENVIVSLPQGQETRFEFDTGPDPQVGQEWILNKDLETEGYHARLVAIKRLEDGYQFTIKADPSVVNVGAWFDGYTATGGGGGGDGQGNLQQSNFYQGALPSGKFIVVFAIQTVRVPGQWTIAWQPEVPPKVQPGASTPQPAVCVTGDNLAGLAPLPSSLAGEVVIYQSLAGSQDWGLVLSTLDGSRSQVVTRQGNWPALSPDGRQMVYSWDALYLADLQTGQVRVLPGTNGNDFNPFWSPDGKWIAFENGVDGSHMKMIAADGSDLRELVNDPNHGSLAGWSPDSTKIYYTSFTLDGVRLFAIDRLSGAVQAMFILEDASLKAPFAAVSPDGQWLAYRDRIMNIYLVRMDGTGGHLIVAGTGGAGSLRWSGNWLGVNLSASNSSQSTAILLQPQTCQAYRLPALEGEVQGLAIP